MESFVCVCIFMIGWSLYKLVDDLAWFTGVYAHISVLFWPFLPQLWPFVIFQMLMNVLICLPWWVGTVHVTLGKLRFWDCFASPTRWYWHIWQLAWYSMCVVAVIERSPLLLMFESNWGFWMISCEEAFQLARRRPVGLSWCPSVAKIQLEGALVVFLHQY